MKTFTEWCEHYEYDPASAEAKADYARYRKQLGLFQDLPEEPCFLDDEGPSDDLPQPPHRTVNGPVFFDLYHIASDRGWWLPKGYGYTQDRALAGRFTLADMEAFNLDGCTLHRVQD